MSRFTLIKPAKDGGKLYKTFTKDSQNVITRSRETPGVYFKAQYRDFSNFREMCEILQEVESDGNTCLVRGDLSAIVEARAVAGFNVRRTKIQHKDDPPGFQPRNQDWIMIDIDKYEVPELERKLCDPAVDPDSAVRHILDKLPHYFRGVSCWWQFSASQSVYGNSNTVSLHLFFQLDRQVSDNTLRAWAKSQRLIPGHLPVDHSLFDSIQPHYIAQPRFVGMSDPLKTRSGIYEGESTRVVFDVPEEPDTPFEEQGGNIHPLVQTKQLKPHLDQIGDDVGRLGFNDAIKSVVGKYFQLYGYQASDLPLKSMLRQAITDAPLKHDRPMTGPQSIEWYMSDEYLDPLVKAIRDREQTTKENERNVYQEAINRYIYVEEMERFLDLTTLTYRTKSGVTDANASELTKLADMLLVDSNMRKVSRMTYKPGAPTFCEDYDPNTGKIFRAFNSYTPPTIKMGDPADAKWFVDHVAYLCDDDQQATDAILDWCAHLVQMPDEKLNFGILLQGMQGTGKSMLVPMLEQVLGPSNITDTVKTSDIMSDFNEWMQNKLLLGVNEIRDQEEKFKLYNQMKDLITNKYIRINPKGLPAYIVPNRANFMCFTQYEDAVPMDDDDRRFIIHMSAALPRSAEYYADIMDNKIPNLSGAVRSYLMERDLTDFNPKGRAPMTESKREYLQCSSGSPLERWLKESIEGDIFPCVHDLISIRDLKPALPAMYRNVSDATMSILLRKLGAKKLGQRRLAHGRMNIFILRNHAYWLTASDEVINKYYEIPVADPTVGGYYRRPSGSTSSKEF